MSGEQTETTRWGLVVAGLAIAAGVWWWDQSGGADDSDSTIIEPATQTARGTSRASPAPRDFVADLSKQGIETTLNPVASINQSNLVETLVRPLFSVTRRQPAPPPQVVNEPPPPEPPPPPDPSELKLLGVLVAGENSVALVRTKSSRNTVSVRKGEIINGWTVDEINSRQMKVHKENVEAVIPLSSRSNDDADNFDNSDSELPRDPNEEPLPFNETEAQQGGPLPPDEDPERNRLRGQ
jgi:hypothetical protein